MALVAWPGIRPGSTMVSVYNESLLVFLWDEANLPTLEASDADFESGYSELDSEIDKSLRELAKEGILVAYELPQDDAISAEVVVGAPLTKEELAAARWHKPQTAQLSLPSGVLRIDSASTFPLNECDEDESPGRVAVPPGEYSLTLHRLDWQALENDGLWSEGDEWAGPLELIVLVPTAGATPIKGNKPWLRYLGDEA